MFSTFYCFGNTKLLKTKLFPLYDQRFLNGGNWNLFDRNRSSFNNPTWYSNLGYIQPNSQPYYAQSSPQQFTVREKLLSRKMIIFWPISLNFLLLRISGRNNIIAVFQNQPIQPPWLQRITQGFFQRRSCRRPNPSVAARKLIPARLHVMIS